MSVIGSNILAGASGQGGYVIDRSVRLRSSASAYFNRTPATNGNRQKFTFSYWAKKGALSASQEMYFTNAGGGTFSQFSFTAGNVITFASVTSSVADIDLTTAAVYRDPASWYHIVLSVDTTQATSTNRVLLYVNGVVQAVSGTYPAQNYNCQLNTTTSQNIGRPTTGTFDGYLAEYNFIDGQALTPTSFGEYNEDTGVWQPKKYAGTYGTNGFYLNFSDPSAATAAAIGKDSSGNGNNWTPNNISVTSGVTYDSMIDVPTMYADGGNGRGNYPTWNPLDSGGITFSNANLQVSNAATSYLGCRAGMALPTTGKIYFEFSVSQNSSSVNIANVGIAQATTPLTGNQNGATNTAAWYFNQNQSLPAGVTALSGGATTSDVYQVAFDCDTGNYYLGRNNVFYSSSGASTGNPSAGTNQTGTLTNNGALFPWAFGYACGARVNFGQRPFAYTPPTGFRALNTQNLPEPTIKRGNQWFDVSLFTSTGSAQTITNSGAMQPDLVWVKGRGEVASSRLVDSVRGVDKVIYSNLTNAETTEDGVVDSFNSNGFTGGGANAVTSGFAGVAWQWKESATAGFDIVTYTGTGVARTVAHGLGVAPAMVIVKPRTPTSTSDNWEVYHASLGNGQFLTLNSTAAAVTASNRWNNTSPTSTVFSIGTVPSSSADDYVAYCFAEVPGFSKFGSYTGNGSTDGPFVFCGFRPAFVMIKVTNNTYDWEVADSSRSPNNFVDDFLVPNSSAAENANVGAANSIDFLSNGFKIRANWTRLNDASGTFIYMAFAEHPFKNALAR